MKKILLIALAIVLLASNAFAWANPGNSVTGSKWKTYFVDNSSTTLYQLTRIPKTLIVPGQNVILGYDIIKYNFTDNAESVVCMYDGDGAAYGEVIGEAEKDLLNQGPVWYPYPRGIDIQLTINQGPNTRVIIYFE
jgi:hypothetical protein